MNSINIDKPSEILRHSAKILTSGPEVCIQSAAVIAKTTDWAALIGGCFDRNENAMITLMTHLVFIEQTLKEATTKQDRGMMVSPPYIRDSLEYTGINRNPFGRN